MGDEQLKINVTVHQTLCSRRMIYESNNTIKKNHNRPDESKTMAVYELQIRSNNAQRNETIRNQASPSTSHFRNIRGKRA